MQLVEQHIINKTDSRFQSIDEAAFASKNLYNAANYRKPSECARRRLLLALSGKNLYSTSITSLILRLKNR